MEYVKREVPVNDPKKSFLVEKMPPVGGGKDWCTEVKKEKIVDRNEEEKEGEVRYAVDDRDKNWALMEYKNHQMGFAVLAEISCVNDHAHIGYLIEDCKTLKTGLGKRHF